MVAPKPKGSPLLAGLSGLAKRGRIRVVIPEVVVKEGMKGRADELLGRYNAARDNIAEFNDLTRAPGIDLPEEDLEDHLRATEEEFRRDLKEMGFEIAGPPDVDLEEIQEIITVGCPPFDEREDITDYFVFRTAKSIAEEAGEATLVSQNTSEFSRDGSLHPKLSQEVDGKLKLSTGLQEVHTAYLQGLLGFDDADRETLRSQTFQQGIRTFVENSIPDEIDFHVRKEANKRAFHAGEGDSPEKVRVDELKVEQQEISKTVTGGFLLSVKVRAEGSVYTTYLEGRQGPKTHYSRGFEVQLVLAVELEDSGEVVRKSTLEEQVEVTERTNLRGPYGSADRIQLWKDRAEMELPDHWSQ